jgi:hypothetical protein
MENLDERIRKFMSKEVKFKTILIDPADLDKVVGEHESEGWKLVRKAELNGRLKVTFEIVK